MLDNCVGGEWARVARGMFYSGQGGALSILTSLGRRGDLTWREVTPGLLPSWSRRQNRQTCCSGGAGRDMLTRVEIPGPIEKPSTWSERPMGNNRLKGNELGNASARVHQTLTHFTHPRKEKEATEIVLVSTDQSRYTPRSIVTAASVLANSVEPKNPFPSWTTHR